MAVNIILVVRMKYILVQDVIHKLSNWIKGMNNNRIYQNLNHMN